MHELCTHTASELAGLVRAGDVSCREVIEAHLARIQEVNEGINAITVALSEEALAAADRADRATVRGPLHGVPFTIKESIDCLGTPTTFGVPALRRAMPYLDAPIVARMRAAGAVPIGRTNLSEMGLRLCTDNPLRGRTLNPWDAGLTVGGSSGGDAAAVATGMSPLGLGSDMGGSLRVPAACCGVAALKPTTGRIPHASSLEPQDSGMSAQAMWVQGPLARSVDDLQLALSVLAGRDVRDPRSVDAPLRGPAPEVRRAALITELPGLALPAPTIDAIERAGALLEAQGWQVEVAMPPELVRVNDTWGRLMATDLEVQAPMMAPILTPELSAHLERICARYGGAVSNLRLHAERSRLTRAWSGFLSYHTVAIGPCWSRPLWPPGADLDPDGGLDLLADTVSFVLPANVLGLPALALPTGVVDGLPTGIQIYADLWREDLCLDAARIIEAGVEPCCPIDPAG